MKCVILLFALLACSPDPGLLVPYAQRIEPPALFRELYARAEECLQKKGDFGRVKWYVADGLRTPEGNPAWGLWRNHEVYLDPRHVTNESTVLHESLHDVRNLTGHPPVPCCHGANWAVCEAFGVHEP